MPAPKRKELLEQLRGLVTESDRGDLLPLVEELERVPLPMECTDGMACVMMPGDCAKHGKCILERAAELAPAKIPVCEECNEQMHQFAAQEGDRYVEGWSCDSCGWSFDVKP